MSFRLRLILFIVAILAIIQIVTAVLVYRSTREASIEAGERQLSSAAAAVVQQLDEVSVRVADAVQVMSLDYALRASIAQRDRQTLLSALRNHGRRVGATRMMLLDLDGSIAADTGAGPDVGKIFPFDDLFNEALEHPASAVVAANGQAHWTVVVPVFTPALNALIAASIPIDGALLARMQRQSAVSQAVELVTQDDKGAWRELASGKHDIRLSAQVQNWSAALDSGTRLVTAGGAEYLVKAVRLTGSRGSAPVAVVIGYSLDEALAPFRSVGVAWAILLALGLLTGVVGALLIGRSVSRPVERLALRARKIASGDYSLSGPEKQRGEMKDLSLALTSMTQAIAEREEQIHHQATHDAVTLLANRTSTEQHVQRELKDSSNAGGAMLMIALGQFAAIIKTMGHAIGDRVMRDAAARLRQLMPVGFVARVTDNTFAIWLQAGDRAAASALAFRVLDALAEPYQESGLTVDLAPSVGVALAPDHGDNASTLLQRGEVAVFAAIARGEAVSIYDPTTDPHRAERLSLMTELQEAIASGQLQLHYQPKLNLSRGRFDAVEGLVRWQHPLRGAIAPDAFIGLAEETGNIRRLTRWVLATGVAQARSWFAQAVDLRVALNLSARDLDDAELPQRVAELLALQGLPAANLVLEVTESAVMRRPEASTEILNQLASMGITLAIDDFGVGQSSFAYLRRLPVSELKIDKAFVRELGSDRGDQTIVHSIVELGHRLGCRVTAEGVEDAAALEFLRSIDCDHAQGYHLCHALPAELIPAFLITNRVQQGALEGRL